MKTIIAVIVFVLSFSTVVYNANAGISPVEFRGYAELGDEQLFSLRSTQGRGSAWVHLGQSFCEGKLVDYDPMSKSVTYSNAEGTFNVKMFEAEESGDLADNFRTPGKTGLGNVKRRPVPKRGSIPRVSTVRSREEKIAAGRIGYTN